MKPKIRRFVLADPSISSSKGHYLEYAVRVLKAVERKGGWTPALAVNRVFDPLSLSRHDFEVDAAFTYDIWGRRPSGAVQRKSLAERASVYRHRLGRTGFVWELSKDLELVKEYACRTGMSSHQMRWLKKAVEFRWNVERLPRRSEDEPLDSLISRVLAGERAQLSAGPSMEALQEVEDVIGKAEAFRDELACLISRMKLGGDDFVFMPTMGWHDLAGVMMWMKSAKAGSVPRFGLLFRRNIYDCYPQEFDQYGYVVHDLRVALAKLAESDPAGRISFLTDTAELAAEYNSISEREFSVLPIPAPIPAETKPRAGADKGARSLVYLGDARHEKGFQLLPALLNAHSARELAGDKPSLRLRSQCYFAPGFKDAGILSAAAIVRNHAPALCDVIEGVLDGDAYEQAVHDADAILVPYERKNYVSRSSGIFIEALAADKPVVVSAGTSMANILDAATYAYHRRAISKSDIIGQSTANAINWQRMGSDRPADVDEKNQPLIRPGEVTFAIAPKPRMATHLWLSFNVTDVPSLFVQLIVAARDGRENSLGPDERFVVGGGKAVRSVLIPVLEEAADIWLSASTPYSETQFTLENATLRWLHLCRPVARSVGGVTFVNDGSPEERKHSFLSAVDALEADFAAYQESITELGRRVRQFHNADRLVAEALFSAGVEPDLVVEPKRLVRSGN